MVKNPYDIFKNVYGNNYHHPSLCMNFMVRLRKRFLFSVGLIVGGTAGSISGNSIALLICKSEKHEYV